MEDPVGTEIVKRLPDGTFKHYIVTGDTLKEINPVLLPHPEEFSSYISKRQFLYNEQSKRYLYLLLKGVKLESKYSDTVEGSEERELFILHREPQIGLSELEKAKRKKQELDLKGRSLSDEERKTKKQLTSTIYNWTKKMNTEGMEEIPLSEDRLGASFNNFDPKINIYDNDLYYEGIDLLRRLQAVDLNKGKVKLPIQYAQIYNTIMGKMNTTENVIAKDIELYQYLKDYEDHIVLPEIKPNVQVNLSDF